MMISRKQYELERLFALVHAWARKRSRRVPKLSLHVGCEDVAKHRRGGDQRAFFHVGHLKNRVCTTLQAADLHPCFLVGLMLHEIGHPMAQMAWGTSEQYDADRAVREFIGVRLVYKGPLLLEWVSPTVVERIVRGKP